MTPDNTELVDRLAAEYVLGTLRGPARRRFERWRQSTATVDARCRLWEERLLPLARGIRPVRPPPRVWDGIARRLRFTSARPQMAMWPWALAASLLLAAGATFMFWNTPGRVTQLATIAAPSGQAAWIVEVYAGREGQLVIRSGTLPPLAAGHAYELWALPAKGSPVSLGVLPATGGVARRVLAAAQIQALSSASQVAVSLEPAGGSPTGAPTGPVVLTAPLRAAS